MLSFQITSAVPKHKKAKRVGKGSGSKRGKTCGRGHKGSGSRAGSFARPTYEGGQMPLFRRLPKRGFSNYKFARRYEIVNVCQLDKLEEGAVVGIEQLFNLGLIDSTKSKVKILGNGLLTKKLQVSAHKFSRSAEQKIISCGGMAKVVA